MPLRLPESDYEALSTASFISNTSMNAIACNAVHDYLQSTGSFTMAASYQTTNAAAMDSLTNAFQDTIAKLSGEPEEEDPHV